MARYCTNCGHELRDTDKFCAECATPVSGIAPSGRPTTYETCEIKWRRTLNWPVFRYAFFAEAIGQRGMYSAGQSDSITGPVSPTHTSPSDKAQQALTAFIAGLTTAGWESVPDKGPDWYSYKFRRAVRN